MPSFKSLATTASLLASALALPQGQYGGAAKKALYFLQNNPAGSSLLALDVTNGQAGNPVKTMTGGVGAAAVNMTNNQPVKIDTLNGQGAVAVGGDYVFTVNSGSNTLAMFKINPWNPTHPTMVGQPVDTMGDFPMSVAYDECYNKVCVLNGGAKNNVACWSIDKDELCQDGEPRPLGLNLSTPPVAGSGTASQIGFSPDSSHVVVTVKGQMMPMTPGSIYVFPVENGSVGQQPVKSSVADVPMPFGFAFGKESSKVLVSDPSFGGSVIDINAQTLMTTEVKHTMSSLNASCWAAYSPATGYGYAIDAATPKMAAFDYQTGDLKGELQIDAAFMGAFDTVFDEAVAYFIAAIPSVGAYDVQQQKTMQNLNLQGMQGVDDRQWWTGMAMWSSKY